MEANNPPNSRAGSSSSLTCPPTINPQTRKKSFKNRIDGFLSNHFLPPEKCIRSKKKDTRPTLNASDLTADGKRKGKGKAHANGQEQDHASFFKSNSNCTKINQNHLLNFSFPERINHSSPSKRYQPSFNKERFVNSNFRFVMNSGYNEKQILADPDVYVGWENIIPSCNDITCPICLSTAEAPRVGKCGHTFCFPCIRHYLADAEHSWRKCPICFDSIYLAALKPVCFLPVNVIDTSTLGPSKPVDIEFTLIRRDPESTIALPIISYRKWKSLMPSVDLAFASSFSRMLTATPKYISKFLNSDLETLQGKLQNVLQSGDSSYEIPFVEMCIEAIKSEIKEFEKEALKKNPDPKFVPGNDQESYFFYQAADGQNIFLHPLDIKVLKREFGEYSSFPSHIKLPVVAMRESTVNNDLRRRCKYLSHLPLACDISFVEIDMSCVVSASTLSLFSGELAQRMSKLASLEEEREQTRLEGKLRARQKIPELYTVLRGREGGFEYLDADFVPLTSTPAPVSLPSSWNGSAIKFTPKKANVWRSSPDASPGVPESSLSRGILINNLNHEKIATSSSWTLEIPDSIFESIKTIPVAGKQTDNVKSRSEPSSTSKKRAQKVLLIGNAMARNSLYTQ